MFVTPDASVHLRQPWWRTALHILGFVSLLLGMLGLLGDSPARAQVSGGGPVHIIEIQGEIDLGLSAYLRRALGDAEDAGAAAAILDINTPGGRLDAALDMKNALLDSSIPTIAFVNREAYSAGALIAISTERVYMTPGSVLGAATPVTGEGVPADEKIISAVRSAFRSVAETRGLDPRLAEAMVDKSVEVPGLVDSDSILTLSTEQAVEWDYATAISSFDAMLEAEGLADNELVQTSPGIAEALVRFITNPVVASLLISIGFLGLLFELQSPGFGLGGAVGLTALAAFFGGHLLAGLAGWEGIALVVIGIALLAVEMFIVPGFGVAGILGIAAFLGGLYISLVGRLPTTGDYLQALWVVLASLVLMIVGGYLSIRFLPKRAAGGLVLVERLRRLSPEPPEEREGGSFETIPIPGLLQGARGRTITDLHPAGAMAIEDKRIDVVAEEGFIAQGTLVEVLLDEGYRRIVRAVDEQPAEDAQPAEEEPEPPRRPRRRR